MADWQEINHQNQRAGIILVVGGGSEDSLKLNN